MEYILYPLLFLIPVMVYEESDIDAKKIDSSVFFCYIFFGFIQFLFLGLISTGIFYKFSDRFSWINEIKVILWIAFIFFILIIMGEAIWFCVTLNKLTKKLSQTEEIFKNKNRTVLVLFSIIPIVGYLLAWIYYLVVAHSLKKHDFDFCFLWRKFGSKIM
ncbi:hypothetical protein [Spiroplasma clarkii]|uniref:Uncharacterized protein n=1 Tax=Spiroplasma clarkii TaxID=2139 RepID=A0A2K8KQ33_9MOLU|nr:hypothetical protein [Spiroplasma clarkii]ATX71416.1 hypothetical protein SCLAR_v1c11160 [Spiroplasma clarkii]